ncbi:MAG TPA: VOC family protein [Bacteroidales bacterium]|nr:VOC family protein [Bacteroidales bacterium]
MKKGFLMVAGLIASFALGFYLSKVPEKKSTTNNIAITKTENQNNMKLGAFSISLSVKDLKTSKEFYEKLGFTVFGGSMEHNYLIMKNDNSLIGLFQGMFQGNILTFNPGWDENARNVENFEDIRKIQKQLKNNGLTLISEADEQTEGPASLMLTDPDGNMILLDQHR